MEQQHDTAGVSSAGAGMMVRYALAARVRNTRSETESPSPHPDTLDRTLPKTSPRYHKYHDMPFDASILGSNFPGSATRGILGLEDFPEQVLCRIRGNYFLP